MYGPLYNGQFIIQARQAMDHPLVYLLDDTCANLKQ
jgi:hypothetical protein